MSNQSLGISPSADMLPKVPSCSKCASRVPCSNCRLKYYIQVCELFRAPVDPCVVSAIHTGWQKLHVSSRRPTDPGMLALSFTLPHLTNLEVLNLGSHASKAIRGDGNWLCRSLSAGLLQLSNLQVLDLQRLGIDGNGLQESAHGICQLPMLKDLILQHNYLGRGAGTEALISIVKNAGQELRYIDVSCNSLGYMNVRKIAKAATEARKTPAVVHIFDDEPRKYPPAEHSAGVIVPHSGKSGCCCYELGFEGNFVVEEVWNSVLHGIGALASFVGAYDLISKARGQSERVFWACLVYCVSVCLLFTASTLYHSSFLHKRARRVFGMLDHSAIFILIAGTYTPIGLISSSNEPAAVTMVVIEWLMALIGITIHMIFAQFPTIVKSLPYVVYEVILYVAMGHMCLISYESIIVPLRPDVMFTLMLGGALYVIGVIFFALEQVKKIPVMHCVWHIFVVSAAICHYFCVRGALDSHLYEAAHTEAALAAGRESGLIGSIFKFGHSEL